MNGSAGFAACISICQSNVLERVSFLISTHGIDSENTSRVTTTNEQAVSGSPRDRYFLGQQQFGSHKDRLRCGEDTCVIETDVIMARHRVGQSNRFTNRQIAWCDIAVIEITQGIDDKDFSMLEGSDIDSGVSIKIPINDTIETRASLVVNQCQAQIAVNETVVSSVDCRAAWQQFVVPCRQAKIDGRQQRIGIDQISGLIEVS